MYAIPSIEYTLAKVVASGMRASTSGVKSFSCFFTSAIGGGERCF